MKILSCFYIFVGPLLNKASMFVAVKNCFYYLAILLLDCSIFCLFNYYYNALILINLVIKRLPKQIVSLGFVVSGDTHFTLFVEILKRKNHLLDNSFSTLNFLFSSSKLLILNCLLKLLLITVYICLSLQVSVNHTLAVLIGVFML